MECYFANFVQLIKIDPHAIAILSDVKAAMDHMSSIWVCTYCDPRNQMSSILVTKFSLDVGLVFIIYCLLLSCALSTYYSTDKQ